MAYILKARPLLAAALVVTTLCSCASFEPAIPQGYTGPTSTIRDTAVPQSERLVHLFYLSKIEARELRNAAVATQQANQGRGFSVNPVPQVHEIPAGRSRLTIKGETYYAAPILALTNPACQVEGDVLADIPPNTKVLVRGLLSPQSCAVWLEAEQGSRIPASTIEGAGIK